MKRWTLFLSGYFCLCLLAGCANSTQASSIQTAPPADAQEPSAPATSVCRVVEEDDGSLLVAETPGTGILTLSLDDIPLTLDGEPFDPADPGVYQSLPGGSLEGALVTVHYDGSIMESWPGRFSGVTALDISTEGFDDRCCLYLEVLEDLWEVDGGLNEGITELGVDLSATSLTAAEQAAVAWAFGQEHGLDPVQGTYDQLVTQGYITGEPLDETDPNGPKFYQWERGCLFSITEKPGEIAMTMPSLAPGETAPEYGGVTFDAQKWRSGLGAYYFMDCQAVQGPGGHWGPYSVGGEYIS